MVDTDGNETHFGDTLSPVYTRNLIHGSYDVLYQKQQGGSVVPQNLNARVATGLVVTGPGTFGFDVPMVSLNVDPLLDGGPWSQSPTEYGDLYLEGAEPGDRFHLGATFDLPRLRNVVPGDYTLVYDHRVGGTTVPVNNDEPVLDFHTSQGTTIDIDVVTTRLAPTVTLNGLPFPTSGSNEAQIMLRSAGGGEVYLGQTDLGLSPRRVIDGAYRIDYEWLGGSDIPRNSREPVGVTFVPEPGPVGGLLAGVVLTRLLHARRARR